MGIASFSPFFLLYKAAYVCDADLDAGCAFLPAQSALANPHPAAGPAKTYRTSADLHRISQRANSKQERESLPAAPVKRLKIMRQFEPGTSRSCTGQIIISGRM